MLRKSLAWIFDGLLFLWVASKWLADWVGRGLATRDGPEFLGQLLHWVSLAPTWIPGALAVVVTATLLWPMWRQPSSSARPIAVWFHRVIFRAAERGSPEWLEPTKAVELYVNEELRNAHFVACRRLSDNVNRFNAHRLKMSSLQRGAGPAGAPMSTPESEELTRARSEYRALSDETAKLQIEVNASEVLIDKELRRQLSSGTLVARAYLPPVTRLSEVVTIPAHLWDAIAFAGSPWSEARAIDPSESDLRYVRIKISKP